MPSLRSLFARFARNGDLQPSIDLRSIMPAVQRSAATAEASSNVHLSDAIASALASDSSGLRRQIIPTKDLLARSRAVASNNSYCMRYLDLAVELALSNNGVTLDFTQTTVAKRTRDRWDAFTEDVGLEGQSLDELQRQIARTIIEDGEVLTRFLPNARVGIIDSALVDYDTFHVLDDVPLQSAMRGGIIYNNNGERAFYRVRSGDGNIDIPATDILHLRKFVGQRIIRGIPWFAPVLEHLQWLADYDRVFLKGSRLAASTPMYGTVPDSINESTRAKLEEMSIEMDPSKLRLFEQGVELTAIDVSKNFSGSNFDDIRAAVLATTAAGLGVTYDFLSGDVSRANMSSLQNANVSNTALMKTIQRHIAKFTMRLYDRWLFYAIGEGSISTLAAQKRQPKPKYPRVPSIIPHRDAQTDASLIKVAVVSPQTIAEQRGLDPNEEIDRIIEFREKVGVLPWQSGSSNVSTQGADATPRENE